MTFSLTLSCSERLTGLLERTLAEGGFADASGNLIGIGDSDAVENALNSFTGTGGSDVSAVRLIYLVWQQHFL